LLGERAAVAAADRPQKAVVVGNVLAAFELEDQILLRVGEEVVAGDQAEQDRRVDTSEVVDPVVLDIVPFSMNCPAMPSRQ
jgi:hypothetical protein